MKHILIWFIRLYQKTSFGSHKYCKYYPTCSEYAIISLKEYGTIKGLGLSIKRILRCNPFTHGGYDPVPIKEKKK